MKTTRKKITASDTGCSCIKHKCLLTDVDNAQPACGHRVGRSVKGKRFCMQGASVSSRCEKEEVLGCKGAREMMQEVLSSRETWDQFAVVRLILRHLWLNANNRVTRSTQSSEVLPGDEVIFSEIYWQPHGFKAGGWTVSVEVHEIDTPVTSSLVLFGCVFLFHRLCVLNMVLRSGICFPLLIFWIR